MSLSFSLSLSGLHPSVEIDEASSHWVICDRIELGAFHLIYRGRIQMRQTRALALRSLHSDVCITLQMNSRRVHQSDRGMNQCCQGPRSVCLCVCFFVLSSPQRPALKWERFDWRRLMCVDRERVKLWKIERWAVVLDSSALKVNVLENFCPNSAAKNNITEGFFLAQNEALVVPSWSRAHTHV